jgi:polyisoprenoid-binding protein YceI
VAAFDGDLKAKSGLTEFDVELLQGAVESVSLNVSPARIDCRNGTMNEHTLKALKANANPQITFRSTSFEMLPGEGEHATVRARGQLTMAGQSKAVTIEGTASQLANGAVQFRGSFPLMMREWGMSPPSLMLGTIKVGNRVVVNYDVILRP